MNSLSYCGNLVKTYDPDRFLLSMFAPAAALEDLWALFAFNHEIAKTREVVTETQLGLIRLQWWRDALEGVYERDEILEHEVLQALAQIIKKHDLPRDLFDALIYAREFDLEDVLPGNIEGLMNYADFTTTPLLKLAMKICGDDCETEPLQPIATNFALMGLLKALPFHAAHRRCYLPENLMQQHGQRMDHLYEGKPAEGLPIIIEEITKHIVLDVKSQGKFINKFQKLSVIYLKQIKSLNYDVFHPRWQSAPPFKELRLSFFM